MPAVAASGVAVALHLSDGVTKSSLGGLVRRGRSMKNTWERNAASQLNTLLLLIVIFMEQLSNNLLLPFHFVNFALAGCILTTFYCVHAFIL